MVADRGEGKGCVQHLHIFAFCFVQGSWASIQRASGCSLVDIGVERPLATLWFLWWCMEGLWVLALGLPTLGGSPKPTHTALLLHRMVCVLRGLVRLM